MWILQTSSMSISTPDTKFTCRRSPGSGLGAHPRFGFRPFQIFSTNKYLSPRYPVLASSLVGGASSPVRSHHHQPRGRCTQGPRTLMTTFSFFLFTVYFFLLFFFQCCSFFLFLFSFPLFLLFSSFSAFFTFFFFSFLLLTLQP